MPSSYAGDPHWINARYPGACKCGATIARGDRAFCWPKGRLLECGSCGATSSARFAAEVADEDSYSGSWS